MRRQPPTRRPVLALAAALIGSPAVWANSEDSLQFSARHEVYYDSNLFRIAPGLQTATGRSETINTTTLGMLYGKSYSLQRVEVDANLVRRQHQNYSYLDFSALDYRAAWHWSATPRVRGVLAADRITRLNNSSEVSNIAQRNLRTDDAISLSGEADLGAAVRLLGGLRQRRQSNEQLVLQDRDARIRTVHGGLRYVYPSGSYIGYGLKASRGSYLNRVTAPTGFAPTDFSQTEQELTANWSLSARTSVRGSVSYLSRKHEGAPQRDFATPLAELLVRWAPTGKVVVDAALERAVLVTQTDYASYAPGNRISLRPTWNAGARLSLRMQLEHLDQAYRGNPNPGAQFAGRDDATRLARIALDWRPQDALLFTVQVQTEKRSSNLSTFDYTTHGASLAASLQF